MVTISKNRQIMGGKNFLLYTVLAVAVVSMIIVNMPEKKISLDSNYTINDLPHSSKFSKKRMFISILPIRMIRF